MARILIVGGGMAGASLALLLARRTVHAVVLAEQTPLVAGDFPAAPSYDARCSALALGTAEILDALGAWKTLAPCAAPITRIGISHQGHFGSAQIDAADEGVAALGFVAENRHIGHALLSALRATRVELRAPAKVLAVKRAGAVWIVDFAGGEKMDVDLLVVADGAQSPLRKVLGILADHHDYGALALVANVSTREPHAGMALERFTRDGAVALLPLPGEMQVDGETRVARTAGSRRMALVWSSPAARTQQLLALPDKEFLAELNLATGGRLGGIAHVGTRNSYPLVKVIANAQVVPGAVVVGNAAHLLNPVAAQGFNLTLRDLATLTATLVQADAQQEAIGELAVLQRYVDARARDQAITAGLSHGLSGLFGNDNPLLGSGRDLGLLAFDLLAPLKREFARQTMGVGIFTGGVSRAG